MANEPVERSGSLLQSVTRMVESAVNDGTGYESLIPILSLLCLVSILGHGQPRAAQATPTLQTAGTHPLQKLLGDLAKGEGGGVGPETLVSLLPLLNSPQIKSKLNPATLGAIMGLLGNIGDKGDKGDKGEAVKQDKGADRAEKSEEKRVVPPPTAATATTLDTPPEKQEGPELGDGDKKSLGKYLNWKSNF